MRLMLLVLVIVLTLVAVPMVLAQAPIVFAQDGTAKITQEVVDSWFVTLVKLAIFSVCVAAAVEALKHFAGAFINEEQYRKFFTADRIRTITFAVAFALCWSIDYGILFKAVEPGVRSQIGVRGDIGPWVDYFVTASINMVGARWAFERLATSLAGMQAVRKKALKDIV